MASSSAASNGANDGDFDQALTVTFRLNGQNTTITTHPQRSLLDVLREDLKLTGTKYGCGEGQCRACTVIMNDQPALACLTRVSQLANKTIQTIEGFSNNGQLHPVQEAFLTEGAFQCGYCTPGMILRTIQLLANKPQPTRAEIIAALNPHLCRCCGYPKIVLAVQRAARPGSQTQAISTKPTI
jgi:aerobic carbon-monoxide dehydrogenase small subunit